MKIKLWKHLGYLLACSFFSILLSSCAAGPKFSTPTAPPEGKSVVYFYRQAAFMGASSVPGIIVNGKEVLSDMPTWSWWPMTIAPGTYELEPKLFGLYKKTSAQINNDRPGQVFYVRLDVNLGYVGLKVVPEGQALTEISKCHLVGQDKSPSGQEDASPTAVENPPQQKTVSKKSLDPPAREEAPPPSMGRLFVESSPQQASIRILNIRPKFHQGMELDAGRYHIEVSAPEHETDLQWIDLREGEDKTVSVSLQRVPIEKEDPRASQDSPAKIFVETSPADATIRILNIKPKFKQGIPLKPGDYHIEVSASGYETKKQWVQTLPGKTLNLDIRLTPFSSTTETAKPAYEFKDLEKRNCVYKLTSSSAVAKREAAKIIIRRYQDETRLLDLVEAELIAGSRINSNDRYHVDAMAWLCKALGNSHNDKYRGTLERVSQEATSRKVRGYAEKSLRSL